jgi:hypothetical protein
VTGSGLQLRCDLFTLLAAIPNASYLEVHGFGLDRFLTSSLAIVDGEAMAPDQPGRGVAFDWEALEACRDA